MIDVKSFQKIHFKKWKNQEFYTTRLQLTAFNNVTHGMISVSESFRTMDDAENA